MDCGSWISDLQELAICWIRVVTVELSERIRRVVSWLEEKTVVAKGPPGRVVLSGEPY